MVLLPICALLHCCCNTPSVRPAVASGLGGANSTVVGEACPELLTCHDTVGSQVPVVITCCWFLDHYRLVVGIQCLNLHFNILTPTSPISKNSIACVVSCILVVDVMGFGLQLLRALLGRTFP